MRKILLALCSLISLNAYAAGIQRDQGKVDIVRVQYYKADTACFRVGARWFKLDLSQTKGNAAFSLVLTANTANKDVIVQWNEDLPLEGGCDSGATMYPLYSVRIK